MKFSKILVVFATVVAVFILMPTQEAHAYPPDGSYWDVTNNGVLTGEYVQFIHDEDGDSGWVNHYDHNDELIGSYPWRKDPFWNSIFEIEIKWGTYWDDCSYVFGFYFWSMPNSDTDCPFGPGNIRFV